MNSFGKYSTLFLMSALIANAGYATPVQAGKLNVVTTLTDYAYVARFLGEDRVDVKAISEGDQDAHFVRPKPSFAVWMSKADLFVTTGLDLELWVPTLLDKAGNSRIREGQRGYVAAADGIPMLEIPTIKDRSQGGVHIYGNPHIQSSPLNMRQVAKNIAIGLIKNDPENRTLYEARLAEFGRMIDRRMFGEKLVKLLGADTLERLARSGNLVDFLKGRTYKGEPMLNRLGGWMKKALPLRGKRIVSYHKNWIYFTTLFGLEVIGEVEPKPAIPPSPLDVKRLITRMRDMNVKVILAANYFDENKVRKISDTVGGRPVIVPMSVGGIKGLDDYFALVDFWIDGLNKAFSHSSKD